MKQLREPKQNSLKLKLSQWIIPYDINLLSLLLLLLEEKK